MQTLTKRLASSLLAALCISAVTACGGGGSTSTALPAPVATAASNGATSNGTMRASLVVHVPNQTATGTSTARRTQYVSSSTQSISAAITPQAGCTGCSQAQTVSGNLLPSGANCTTGASGADCTVALSLLPGTYKFDVTTFAGPLAAGTPTGAALSVDTGLPVTITGGQANTIGVTLNGIPASLRFSINTPDPTRSIIGTTLFAGQQGAIYALTASAIDAGGNLITGMGTTTVTTTLTPGTPAAGITANAVPNSNFIDIETPSTPSLNVDILHATMHGANCSLTGAVCTAALNLRFTQVMAVIDSAGVDVFTPWGSHIATVSNGVHNAVAVAFDPEGNLLVANNTSNTVTVYGEGYSLPPTFTVNGIAGPLAMTASRDGEVFVTNGTTIYELTDPYTAVTTTLTGFADVGGLATDSVDSLYVSDISAATVSKFTLPYTPQATALAYMTSLSAGNLVVNSHNIALVGNRNNGKVAELSATGSLLAQTIQTSGITMDDVIIDRSDNIAVIDGQVHGVDYAAAPAYTPTFLPLPVAAVAHSGVFDQFGNLYVEGGNSIVYTFLAPTMQAGPTITLPNNSTGNMAIWSPDP
jgi:hypothetical protein